MPMHNSKLQQFSTEEYSNMMFRYGLYSEFSKYQQNTVNTDHNILIRSYDYSQLLIKIKTKSTSIVFIVLFGRATRIYLLNLKV